MVGVNLTLDLPALSDPLATSIAKIRAALSQLGVTVSDKVSQSAIALTGSFDFAGNGAVNVAQTKFLAGTVPTTAGSLYYSAGSLWFRDGVGAVKITDAGALSADNSTGFTGDYGQPGIEAAAQFHNSSAQYRFYANEGELTFGDLAFADYHHASAWKASVGLVGQLLTNANLAPLTGSELSVVVKATGASWRWTSQSHSTWGLRVGDRVTKVTYELPTTGAGTYTVTYGKQGASETLIDQWTFTGGSPVSGTRTIATPVTIVDGENHFVSVTGPGATDVLRFVGVEYIRP